MAGIGERAKEGMDASPHTLAGSARPDRKKSSPLLM
jgi:hypothetical protein